MAAYNTLSLTHPAPQFLTDLDVASAALSITWQIDTLFNWPASSASCHDEGKQKLRVRTWNIFVTSHNTI